MIENTFLTSSPLKKGLQVECINLREDSQNELSNLLFTSLELIQININFTFQLVGTVTNSVDLVILTENGPTYRIPFCDSSHRVIANTSTIRNVLGLTEIILKQSQALSN